MKLASVQRPLDVIEKAEAYARSGRFLDLNRACVHERLSALAKSGQEVPDALLQHIHDQQLNFLGATAESVEEFWQQEEAFEKDIWPAVRPLLKQNAGAAQLMLEYGVHSRFVATFLCDIQRAQGVSLLLGHGIGHTVTDELVELSPTDGAFAFYHDASFGIFRLRAKLAQGEMYKAKRILFLGGGADPALYARRYPLGELDQRIVLYDNDPQMRSYLEEIVGPLDPLNVEYRVDSIQNVLYDQSQFGQYDLVCLLGVAAYFSTQPEVLFDGVYKLLAPGGKLVFDLQFYHPVLAFDVLVLGWPTTMHVEDSEAAARLVAQQYCANSGLRVLWQKTEDPDLPQEAAAGVVTLAEKSVQ